MHNYDAEADDVSQELLNQKAMKETEIIQNGYECNTFLNSCLSYDELEKVISRLKNNKAIGCDGIPNEVLCNYDVTITLFRFFSIVFESGIIPAEWKKCFISPIPKCSKKDPFLPLNYRGISLLSCVGKLYSSILSNRIVSYSNICNILVDEQNGFRKNSSCSDHIFTLSSVIQNRLHENKATFAAFLDMEKAFDRVNRDLLFLRLLEYGIDGKLYNSIKNMYDDNKSSILLNDLSTDWFIVTSGVRQGDTLSPILFSLFINELAVGVKNLNLGIDIGGILLYADDIVLMSESEENLQKILDYCHKWCWMLKINVED